MISDSFTYYVNTYLTLDFRNILCWSHYIKWQAKGQRNCEAESESITSSSVIVLVFHGSHPESIHWPYFGYNKKRRKQRQRQRHCLPPCVVIYDMAPLAKERMKASVVRKVAAVAVSWHGNDDGHDGHHGVGDGDQDDYVGDKCHPSAISRQDDSSIQLLPSIVEAACAFS